MPSHQLFSTGKVAKIVGASVEAVNNWIRAGKLKAFRTPGGHYRVDSQDLLEFRAENGTWMNPEFQLDPVPRILVIDDEIHMRELVKAALEEEYEVSTAGGGLEGCLIFGDVKPNIIIVDVKMPDVSGYEVIRTIKEKYQGQVRTVVMTGYPGDPEVAKLRLLKVDAFLNKPFDLDELKRAVYSVDETDDGERRRPPTIQ